MASCAPLKRGRPSTTTSSLRPSAWTVSRAMSRRKTLVETLPPASLHTLAAALSRAYPRLPRTPALEHAARWWPLESSGRPHRQTREVRGRGSQRRRKRRTRNSCDENLEWKDTGEVVNGTPERGPLWDRNRARSPGDNLGHTAPRRKHSSEALEAGRCHPCAASAGSASSRPRPGRKPWATAPHLGASEAPVKQNLPAFSSTLEMESTTWVVQGRDEFLCHDWVATLDGRQRMGPTCPVRGKPSAGRTAKAQTSHAQRQTPVEESAKTLPNACIVLSGEALSQTWMNNPETVVGSRRSAKQQQEPSALQVCQSDPLEEGTVGLDHLLQLGNNALWVAQWSAADGCARRTLSGARTPHTRRPKTQTDVPRATLQKPQTAELHDDPMKRARASERRPALPPRPASQCVSRLHRPPTMDRTVARGSMSVMAWMACATHSPPHLVVKANWNGAVAFSTSGFNCWATVRATGLRTMSPETMPRTPPEGFESAVMRPKRMASTTSEVLKKETGDMVFSEEWKRTMYEMQCGVLRGGKHFSNSSVSFLPWAYARGNVILWMRLLSPIIRWHNQQDQSKISSFDCTELSWSSGSLKRKKARISTNDKKIIGKLWMPSELRKKDNHSSILDR